MLGSDVNAAAIRVLVVDDDEDDFILARDLLARVEGTRFEVEWAGGFEAGMTAIAADRHDVCLVDYQLGPASGVDLVRAAIARGSKVPMIVLTGHGSSEIDRETMRAGAADYLVKGRIDVDRVDRAIRYAIGRARDNRALLESAVRYRELFERNPMPLWVFDGETLAFLAVNDAAVDHYGYGREEFLRMSVLDIRPEEDKEEFLERMPRQRRGLTSAGLWRHVRRDGSLIDVDITSHGLVWEGRDARLVLVNDVTETLRVERATHQREAQLRQLLSDTMDALLVVDTEGRVRFANPAMQRLLGQSEEALELAPMPPALDIAIGEAVVLELGPEHRIAEAKAAYTTWQGEDARLLALRDITDRRQAEDRLRLLERAIEASANGVLIADARLPGAPLIYVNAAFERITGYAAADVLGRNCSFLQGEDRAQPEVDVLRRCLAQRIECQVVLRNYRKDGTLFWSELSISPVRDAAGEVTHFVGVLNDLTERRRYEAELAYAASHDAVTGLPRYVVLEEYTLAALADAARQGTSVALLHVDIDRFHTVSETMGHAIGDQALREVAERLRVVTGARGRVGSLGGDEFVIALPFERGKLDPLQLAEELRRRVEATMEIAPYKLFLSCTVGMSVYPEHGRGPLELLRHAEAALLRAKKHGRNTVMAFSNEQAEELRDRVALGGRLRDAILRNEMVLHYQPQVSAADGRVLGVEALVRWQTPDLGLLPPGRFIRVAEELGLIVDLGHWVLDEACRQAKAWLAAGLSDFSIAVNVSALQFQRPAFVDEVRDTIASHALPPAIIELELTESAIMENIDRMAATMHALRKLGVKLALDDFGIGYSSLNYLKRFPIDKLKIDQSFVREITHNSGDAAITRAIIAMGHQLQMTVMAEGVETEAQLGYLRRNHCDQCQGMFFGMAMPAAAAEEVLRNRFLNHAAFAATHPGQTLLLLDDEENILKSLSRLLRRDGYRVLTATTSRDAFELLGRNDVQVIVSDQRMPDISGTEFLSRVKEMYPQTVRMVLSGYTDLKTVTEAINRGAIYKFLTKPWEDEELRNQIKDAFRTYAGRAG